MTVLKRNDIVKINQLLDIFPIVLILGVRQCGKTTLAKQARPEWKYFDLENISDIDFISNDLDFFFKEYSANIIIDEAQELPQLFKQLRGVIDADRSQKNRFILTGSSSPQLIGQASDSLAGRLGIIELGTFKRNEIRQKKLPDFYQILNRDISIDSIALLKKLQSPQKSEDIIEDFLRGGYPEPVIAQNALFYNTWMNNYFQLYINRDLKKLFPRIDATRYRRFISTLSELSGTIINKAQLGRSIDTNEVTIRDYLDIADKTFVWRIIPSYEKSKTKSLVKMPKGILRDSGLIHFLANIDNREKLIRSPNVGQNFESYIIEELIKGMYSSDAVNCFYYYYRTKHGSEVDLILEGSFGLLPIEIKFSTTTKLKQLTSLTKFVKDNELPFGIVINNASEVRMLSERIIQIPALLI
ncbi:MAG: ATP-binding protein [gamma proteobacterium symbiont of Taylorina sp.]|nr:ATP-binding protein [gamma proteobacterium symbiont of Taylorina sp.]